MEIAQALPPEQTTLECTECGEIVYVCSDCGEYIAPENEIYCDEKREKHYCIDCGEPYNKSLE
jgi:hypothetical protein